MQPRDTKTLKVGGGMRLMRTPAGACLSMQSATWHHPWFTAVYWVAPLKKWVAVVRPGFVNGKAPMVLTTVGKMQMTPAFLAPITAWDGAADIAQAAILAEGEETTVNKNTAIWVPLYRNPMLALAWREVLTVPKFFSRRAAWFDASSPTAWAASRRRLVSSDIVLHQPRAALTSQITEPVDLLTGSSIVTQTLGLREPDAADHLKVFSVDSFEPVDNYNNTGELLRDYEEPTWDEILLAKVYLVSPPDATGNPDESWIPFVQHELFWNLNWAQPAFAPLPGSSNVQAIPPLAGGVGYLVINSMIASYNDMISQALNITVAYSMAGTFWTATGGGSDSTFPTETVTTQDSFGLLKSAQAKAKRAGLLAQGALIDRLDPSFPYRARPFSLSLLN